MQRDLYKQEDHMTHGKTFKAALSLAIFMTLLFVVLTTLLLTLDRQPIGANNSLVGLGTLNSAAYSAIGSSPFAYEASEILGYVALVLVAASGCFGLYQLIKGKSLKKVDADIYMLAVLYLAVVVCYVLFEKVIINYRPNEFEASYPSSHTMLALSVFLSSATELYIRLKNKLWALIPTLLGALTVALRLLSGVHWFTDILGGVFLGLALSSFFLAAVSALQEKKSLTEVSKQ